MTAILPIKLSILSLPTTIPDSSTLTLLVSFNSLTELFSSPFQQLPMQLINFPLTSTLFLKFFKGNQCAWQASTSIQNLIKDKTIEVYLNFSSTDEDSPEKTGLLEPNCSKKSTFECLIRIERGELEGSVLEFDQFVGMSQKSLEISIGIRKDVKKLGFDELGMEIFEDFQEVTPQRMKNIKCMFVGVNEKLKVFEVTKERMVKAENDLEIQVRKREKLQEKLKSVCLEFGVSKQELEKQLQELRSCVDELRNSEERLKKVQNEFDEYRKSKDLETEVFAAKLQKIQVLEASEILARSAIAESEVKASEKVEIGPAEKTETLQKSLENAKILEYENLILEYQNSISALVEENSSLSQTNQTLVLQAQTLQSKLESLQQDSLRLQNTILEYQSRCTYSGELESQLLKSETHLKKITSDYEQLQTQFKSTSENYQLTTQALYSEKALLIETNKKLSQDYSTTKEKLIETECKYLELQGKSYESTQNTSLSYTALTEQNLKLLKDSKDFCEVSNKLESSLIHENKIVVHNFLETSTNYLLLQRLQSKLLLFLQDKQAEILALKKVMVEIQKQKAAYVPVRNDYIDNQLANFINSSAVPIEVPFTRLEPGVYLFGTKRVVLRVENIGIVIRVGGGFVKLEDFINNQTGFEVGKIRERERKSLCAYPSPEGKDRNVFPSPEGKERRSKAPSPANEETKDKKVTRAGTMVSEEMDRPESPKVLFNQRTSISTGIPAPKTNVEKKSEGSGIPWPKTVTNLVEKKKNVGEGRKRGSVGNESSLM